MSLPKILILDIETSPNKGYFWGLFKQNIATSHIETPTRMISWAAKWAGQSKAEFRQFRDKDFLSKLHEMMNEADVLVTYNGVKFDVPHIRREFAQAGLPPVRPVGNVDLLLQVRKLFNFPSNKLDYVAAVLLGEHKLSTGGFGLWPAFMAGDEKAIRKMRRYNIKDVRLTERLYKHLRPWLINHPYAGRIPENAIEDYDEPYECPACASKLCIIHRPRRTRCFAIRVVQCKSCGHFYDGKRRKL